MEKNLETTKVSAGATRQLPRRVRELIGYNIQEPFMGYEDGMHPKKTWPPKYLDVISPG
jgi:hypothetical protein